MNQLLIRNRQTARRINTRLLRRITRELLESELALDGYELAIHLVTAAEITRLNEQFLQHIGPTDIITFDNATIGSAANPKPDVSGELFICVEVALAQAREFRTSWQSELARYVIHGILHLRGYDDLEPAARRIMKREENRLLRRIARRFALSDFAP